MSCVGNDFPTPLPGLIACRMISIDMVFYETDQLIVIRVPRGKKWVRAYVIGGDVAGTCIRPITAITSSDPSAREKSPDRGLPPAASQSLDSSQGNQSRIGAAIQRRGRVALHRESLGVRSSRGGVGPGHPARGQGVRDEISTHPQGRTVHEVSPWVA